MSGQINEITIHCPLVWEHNETGPPGDLVEKINVILMGVGNRRFSVVRTRMQMRTARLNANLQAYQDELVLAIKE